MTDATRNLLEQHFDTAFAAPDGIAKLRELILTLAMQGRLVAQDPADPPASELLKEIEAEKQRLVKAGKIKPPKPLPPIKPEEVPYELPPGWEWVRLGEVGRTQTGTTPKSGDKSSYGTDIPFIKPADITSNFINYSNEGLSISGVEKYGRLVPSGSSLMVCIGTIGKTNIIDRDCSFNQQINAITPFNPIFPFYIQDFIRCSFFQNECWNQSSSTTIAILNKGKWESIPLALPPLSEQHRIVARIDELMARCDELEKLRKERDEKRLAVHAAAIRQLLDAPDGSAWDFIQQHFGELYVVKENVAELRKAILQLAVMGRLVEQDPADPPASELLKEIEVEKERLVKAGKIKPPKPLPPIKPEEVPYELPPGWEWVRLIEVGSWALGSGLPLSIQGDSEQEILLCKVSDMNLLGNEKFIVSTNNSITEKIVKQNKLNISEPGTIIFPKIGGAIATNKRRILQKKTVIDNNCLGITPTKAVSIEWCYQLLLSFDFAKYQTGTSIPAISQGIIGGIVIGLPPLPEQHLIVARIDQLMALCDRLDQQIDAATGKRTELLSAVMAQV